MRTHCLSVLASGNRLAHVCITRTCIGASRFPSSPSPSGDPRTRAIWRIGEVAAGFGFEPPRAELVGDRIFARLSFGEADSRGQRSVVRARSHRYIKFWATIRSVPRQDNALGASFCRSSPFAHSSVVIPLCSRRSPVSRNATNDTARDRR